MWHIRATHEPCGSLAGKLTFSDRMVSFKVDWFVKLFCGSAEQFTEFREKFNILSGIQVWKHNKAKLKHL